MMKKQVYLDNNATTKVAPEVFEVMTPYLTEFYGNPSSMHSFGGDLSQAMDRARFQVAELINAAHDYEIVFTGTGTESDNLAIMGSIMYYSDRKHIITSRVEHPAVLALCQKFEREGYRVTYVPVDHEGMLDLDYLYENLDRETAIVSIMYANNETGVIHPVKDIARKCRDLGVPFHVDAVQAVGKIPVDVQDMECDFLSLSGHKFHGPKGVGVLYARRGSRLRPVLFGGHQEKGRRPGTHNVPGIIGLGKAAELALAHLAQPDTIGSLRDRLENGLLNMFSNSKINGKKELRVPNTANIGFEFIEGEAILLYLDQIGIAASSGSACSSGSLEPSHVLRAMGVPFTMVHGSIRFSLSRYTTEDEIDYTLSEVPAVINRLLEISPYWDSKTGTAKPPVFS